MPKARLSTLDVAAEVSCLRQRVLGMRLSNVYDINAKTYLLKLARSGEDGEKVFVVLEAGVRLHSTQYMRDKNTIPSNFTLKLRKHLRSRRLEDVRQLGVDRIVMLSFGSGEAAHHLILEMYSQGNLVLTDAQFQVMTLLRSHRDDNKGVVIMPRHAYPMHSVRLLQALQPQQLQQHLQDAKPQTSLKKAVAAAVAFGTPMVAEHCLLEAGLDPNREAAADPLMEQELQALLAALRRVEAWLTTCSSTEADAIPGFILLRSTSSGSAGAGSGAAPASSKGGAADVGPYEDCLPLLPTQMRDRGFAQFDTFDAALDEFFSKLEGQRAERAEAQAQKTMLSKVDKIRRDHEERIHALKEEAGTAERKARVLERELELVDAAINAVNAALADGMDWMRLQRMVREERERRNPVAAAIHSLDLDHNRATLLLPAPSTSSSDSASDSSNGEEESGDSGRGGASAADRGRKQAAAERARSPVKVEVDLALSAYANAALHYSSKKRHKQKEERTLAVQESVLKTAAVKQQKQVGQVAQRAASKAIQQMRKPMWFEKFNWFVSSENVLVVSGRDVQQNELLVKRHLHAGDAYVHADLHGAPSMVVKNPGGGSQPLPLLTLQEAGCACVCRSKAWDQKIVTSAWWVYDHQVSKTPPSGEYLPAGSFMIRGKKNFLPPSPLVMGLAVLFKLEDSCVAAHAGERAPRSGSMLDGAGAAAEDPVKEQPELDAEAEQAVPGEREEPDERREPDGEEEEEEEEEEGEEEREEGEDSEQGSNGEEGELDDMLDSLLTLRPSPAAPQAGGAAAERGASLDSSGSQQAELYERYHLEEGSTSHAVAAAVAEEEAQGSKGAQPRGKRYLTARERRLMKKGLWQPGRPLPEQPPPEAKPDADAAAAEAGVAGSEPAAAEQKADWQPLRGKRGKEKKRRDKYGDQDDEDRELAMSVLLSAMPQKDRCTRRAERKAKKGAKREAAAAPVAQPGLQEAAIAAALGPLPAAASGQERSAPDRTGGKDATRTRPAANADSDAEEDSHAPEQDEAELSSEASGAAASQDVRERLAQLNSLTGAPLAEDVLLFAVPVCAPYAALASYKYKVKLVPGSQKKGKAAKQALELVLRNPDVRPQERELMRVIPDPEMVAAMVGNVKIASAGIQKVRQDSKKKGKLAC